MFVSIKGIYYQADIKGETITWVVSHKRGYEVCGSYTTSIDQSSLCCPLLKECYLQNYFSTRATTIAINSYINT